MSGGIDIVRLQGIAEELERLHERCDRQLLTTNEASSSVRDVDARLRALLPTDSDAYRLFDRRLREATDYWRESKSGYVERVDCANVSRRLTVVRQILFELEPDFLREDHTSQDQLYFQAGEVYRAKQEFYRLLTRASSTLAIADPYMDPSVLDFVEPLDKAISVRLVTTKCKPLFLEQLQLLANSGRAIEARANDLNHDRFLILDGAEAWHLGTSINSLGKKACMISRVVDADERVQVTKDFESWWVSGDVP